ncbi:MAG: MmcQ/YjbR family DNA-binding protein [Saprospiraceae bacterium]|nr:MmcQ/YjbR family DNA-binding protein [Saprospiraceae bacterium]
MRKIDILRNLALSFPETHEEPHFENISFKVNKKIFATYDEKLNQLCLKLSEIDQNVFSDIHKNGIYPVPNKWGKSGWTFVKMDVVDHEIITDALIAAYCQVAPKKFQDLLKIQK